MVAPYWTGSTSSVEQLDRLNKLCCARLNKLCCTWLLIGQASVPDQPGARHNRACLTGLLITNLPLLFEKLNFTFIVCYGSSQVFFLLLCSLCALLGYVSFKQLDKRRAQGERSILFESYSVRKGLTMLQSS